MLEIYSTIKLNILGHFRRFEFKKIPSRPTMVVDIL